LSHDIPFFWALNVLCQQTQLLFLNVHITICTEED
jgi:hypothetical protein